MKTTTTRLNASVAGMILACASVPSATVLAQTGGSLLEFLPSAGDLTLGDEVSAALSSSDIRAPDDSYIEVWTIEGQTGESVTIDLIADDFDPFLYVTGPGFDETLNDDDSGGACYARITLTYLESGTFRVAASSNMPNATGTYVLRVSDTPGPTAGYACGSMNPAVLMELSTDGRALALGDVVSGVLTASSETIGREAKKAEAWTLEGRAGESVTITLESDSFDSYMYVAGPGLGDVLSDDDSAGDLDSQITVSFPEDGTYTVVASSLSGGSTGPYTIRVEEPTDMRELDTEGRTLGVGEVARGILTSSDAVIQDGRRGQAWALEGVQGETYAIDLISEEFDSYLYLIGPGLSDPVADDDGAGNLDSRITFTFPMDGTYRVIASSLSGGQGPYSIRVEETLGMAELPTDDRVAEVGATHEGWLSHSDPAISEGRHGQAWALRGRAGETYTIDLMSEDLDPYLYVVGPGMPDPRTNDDGGEGFNARITITLPEDGTYRVIASSLSASRMGPYTLRVTRPER